MQEKLFGRRGRNFLRAKQNVRTLSPEPGAHGRSGGEQMAIDKHSVRHDDRPGAEPWCQPPCKAETEQGGRSVANELSCRVTSAFAGTTANRDGIAQLSGNAGLGRKTDYNAECHLKA